jgi:hypothetical protein
MHRGRIHCCGDVEKAQVEGASRQRDLPDVAHERDVRVVDRDGQVHLVLQRGRDAGIHVGALGFDDLCFAGNGRDRDESGHDDRSNRAAAANDR